MRIRLRQNSRPPDQVRFTFPLDKLLRTQARVLKDKCLKKIYIFHYEGFTSFVLIEHFSAQLWCLRTGSSPDISDLMSRWYDVTQELLREFLQGK